MPRAAAPSGDPGEAERDEQQPPGETQLGAGRPVGGSLGLLCRPRVHAVAEHPRHVDHRHGEQQHRTGDEVERERGL
ncbi:hypothetical protein [Kitasatospora sp. NPDC056531]|uniref:hypothetical protein n=1 Tax=Kitasatospora sp. NPDC056531 TaxID=3345856 RepID=UPI0036CAF172